MVAIKILDPQVRNNPKDAFVITCEAMVGDGDEFHKFQLPTIHRTSGYEQKLTEIVELMDAMGDFAWTNTNSYADLPGYSEWFFPDSFEYDGFIATLWEYTITYYDSDGIPYDTAIEREA